MLALLLGATATAAGWGWARQGGVRGYQAKVIATYPHDSRAFTQGLIFHDGVLLEGTGLKGASTLRRVTLATGEVQQSIPLGDDFFGEGITLWNKEIYQLTWQNQVGVVYDLDTFEPLRTFRYAGEGWGLTHDDQHLILSDGSSTLRFIDPKTFEVVRRLSVRSGNLPVSKLNELEYIEGKIWANVWKTDRIVQIDPQTGRAVGWIDLADLWPVRQRPDPQAVLNGIAYDADKQRIFVTGKWWPQLYQIELVERR